MKLQSLSTRETELAAALRREGTDPVVWCENFAHQMRLSARNTGPCEACVRQTWLQRLCGPGQ